MTSTLELSDKRFQDVTISGLPGCGSTTLLKLLREELQFAGWTGFSGGEFMRAYAIEKGFYDATDGKHHAADAYPDDFDMQVDMDIRHKLQNQQHWIIESWLSGFMAQGVSGVLKVLMVCSDYSIRVDRIVNRDSITVEQAKEHLHERYETNLNKWRRMYHQEWQKWVVEVGTLPADAEIDFWRPELYDIVIDTYRTNQHQSLELVLHALQEQKTTV